MLVVIKGAHSKQLEVFHIKVANSSATTEELHKLFSTHGLPHIIVSDNRLAFTSEEYNFFPSYEWDETEHFCASPSIHKWIDSKVSMSCKVYASFAGTTLQMKISSFLAV